MKTWTVEQILAEDPCPRYTKELLVELWAGREKVSLLDILNMPIPDADKLWGAWRGLTEVQTKRVLEKIVTRAVTNHALNCGIREVEMWTAEWLSGLGDEKSAARAAAEAAAGSAARAAWAAAAGSAARAAAWAEERKLQVEDVRSVLAEGGVGEIEKLKAENERLKDERNFSASSSLAYRPAWMGSRPSGVSWERPHKG